MDNVVALKPFGESHQLQWALRDLALARIALRTKERPEEVADRLLAEALDCEEVFTPFGEA